MDEDKDPPPPSSSSTFSLFLVFAITLCLTFLSVSIIPLFIQEIRFSYPSCFCLYVLINLLEMSIALDSNRIERSGFCHGMSLGTVVDTPESGIPAAGIFAGDRRLTADKQLEVGEEEAVESSSSSSIGRDSDTSDGGGDNGEGEVQSSCKGPLDTLDALEEVLPINKRGISKFYGGKSKSFTSLADAVSCSSIKEIVKPEDAYTRKRKNLLAHGALWDKNRHYPPKSNLGGMSKRPASSRSSMALAASLSSYENKNSENSYLISSTPILCRPPLHPHGRRSPYNESLVTSPQRNLSPWRSFSLSDLQCAAATTPCITGLEIISGDEDEVQ